MSAASVISWMLAAPPSLGDQADGCVDECLPRAGLPTVEPVGRNLPRSPRPRSPPSPLFGPRRSLLIPGYRTAFHDGFAQRRAPGWRPPRFEVASRSPSGGNLRRGQWDHGVEPCVGPAQLDATHQHPASRDQGEQPELEGERDGAHPGVGEQHDARTLRTPSRRGRTWPGFQLPRPCGRRRRSRGRR